MKLLPAPGVPESGARRARPALLARRRDPRGPLDRRPREGEIRPQGPRAARARREVRPVHGPDAHVRASTSRAGGRCARARRTPWTRFVRGLGGALPRGGPPRRRLHRRRGRNASRRRGRQEGHGDDLPEGRRQGRDEGALRPPPRDGDPDRDDHGRQPAHGRDDRPRGRRGRLPRRGDARAQARAHPGRAGEGQPRRDDRRRHERRARPSPRRTSAWR